MQFIKKEIVHLMKEDIIEPSSSPWRAQVLVTGGNKSRKRMVVDYSRTINRFTHLDAYPLPRMDEMVRKISQYRVFSTLDLKSAYHQIALKPEEKVYTAFEANGCLYQFKRIPFGVTNGVACFQRIIADFINQERIPDTFAYLDNVTVCGNTQQEHDATLHRFLEAAGNNKLTFNHDKSMISVSSIKLLGYLFSHGSVQSDPERLQSLRELIAPYNVASLRQVMGMFSYYSQWIPHYSELTYPLSHCTSFPLTPTAELLLCC